MIATTTPTTSWPEQIAQRLEHEHIAHKTLVQWAGLGYDVRSRLRASERQIQVYTRQLTEARS